MIIPVDGEASHLTSFTSNSIIVLGEIFYLSMIIPVEYEEANILPLSCNFILPLSLSGAQGNQFVRKWKKLLICTRTCQMSSHPVTQSADLLRLGSI